MIISHIFRISLIADAHLSWQQVQYERCLEPLEV